MEKGHEVVTQLHRKLACLGRRKGEEREKAKETGERRSERGKERKRR